ncbi:unnamed protein product [Rhizoctonia solani]|uniref:Cyanovirin-N domain-containing protein n=1 Tax=Rhizoctonia solani TaxID=456999 RepID=A0A8H3CTX2_9AGAM|nr:unnamed protein product [Rhizoctonia solani]
MSFAESALPESIQLADGRYLVSSLQDSEGNLHESSIDLNEFIGNIDGKFQWGKIAFLESAKNIWLDTAHAPALILLKAELQKEDEDYVEDGINLNEFIQNVEGQFQYIGPSE